LQLSHLELSTFIDEELLRNPLLEREDGGSEAAEPAPVVETAEIGDAYDGIVAQGSEQIPDAGEIAGGLDTAVENVFPDESSQDLGQSSGPDRNGSFEGSESPDLDQFIASRPRLSDHLETQAQMILRTQSDRLIALHLINGLNEARSEERRVGKECRSRGGR